MTPRNPTTTTLAVALAALALAACGSDDDGGSADAPAPAPPKTESGQAATIGSANTDLGDVLVDSEGRTIYLFEKDSGTKSACEGDCAAGWPPVRASGDPSVGDGLDSAKVGTTPRSDGDPQVTYNGHPLYLFAGDKKAGDTNGQDVDEFGAEWYAVSPDGNKNTEKPSGDDSGDGGGGGGGGYGY